MRNKLFEEAECICIRNQLSLMTFVIILAVIGRVHRTCSTERCDLRQRLTKPSWYYQLLVTNISILKPSNTLKSANTCSVDHGNRSYSNYVCTNSNQTFFLQKVSILMLLKSVGAVLCSCETQRAEYAWSTWNR